jgi:hypothetical protein
MFFLSPGPGISASLGSLLQFLPDQTYGIKVHSVTGTLSEPHLSLGSREAICQRASRFHWVGRLIVPLLGEVWKNLRRSEDRTSLSF